MSPCVAADLSSISQSELRTLATKYAFQPTVLYRSSGFEVSPAPGFLTITRGPF
uniref:Uncharacterized protein n=1 Tax=uncultured marine virus TaxID=186617 RepID=A0A0F7LA31_9VIRU|nr:hypothetical protein [uncultured marine virus]